MAKRSLCVVTNPNDLQDGLFGNVFYHMFQVLPALYDAGIYPAWKIRTSEYGAPPEYLTIPGAVDLAYEPPGGPYEQILLSDLRRQRGRVLGSDFAALGRIWARYFRVPERVLRRADEALPAGRGIGIHYRGNDKLTTSDDSNPFQQADYLELVGEFLEERAGDFDFVFSATDEFSFVEKLRARVGLPVVNLGEVQFHKAAHQRTPRDEKTDRAMLDCVLLSRCVCVIETSSALPSFARVFNPELEIYRCAASKLFQAEPYFPVAFIPVLPVKSAAAAKILEASMDGDWTVQEGMASYKGMFASRPRKPLRQALLRLGYGLGAERAVRAVVEMRNRQIRARLRRSEQG